MTNSEEKIKALALMLEVEESEITDEGDDKFGAPGMQEYMVLTDEEADEKWEDELQYYIDDVILPELPEHYRHYFDTEKWINDAKNDGRGHSLNRYDGNEEESTVNGTTYYIYRQN